MKQQRLSPGRPVDGNSPLGTVAPLAPPCPRSAAAGRGKPKQLHGAVRQLSQDPNPALQERAQEGQEGRAGTRSTARPPQRPPRRPAPASPQRPTRAGRRR